MEGEDQGRDAPRWTRARNRVGAFDMRTLDNDDDNLREGRHLVAEQLLQGGHDRVEGARDADGNAAQRADGGGRDGVGLICAVLGQLGDDGPAGGVRGEQDKHVELGELHVGGIVVAATSGGWEG